METFEVGARVKVNETYTINACLGVDERAIIGVEGTVTSLTPDYIIVAVDEHEGHWGHTYHFLPNELDTV